MRLKRFSTAVSPGPSSHRMPFSIVLASILVVLVWVDPVFSGDAGGGIPVERVIDADLLPPPILSLRNEILTRQELLGRRVIKVTLSRTFLPVIHLSLASLPIP